MEKTKSYHLRRMLKKFSKHDELDEDFKAQTTNRGKVRKRSPIFNSFLYKKTTGNFKLSEKVPKSIFDEMKNTCAKARALGKAGVMVYRRPEKHMELHLLEAERHYELLDKERQLEKIKGGENAKKKND